MEWINVNEKLPPNNVAVLITGDNLSIDIGWKLDINNYQWCKYSGGKLYDKLIKITHWQHLPELPY